MVPLPRKELICLAYSIAFGTTLTIRERNDSWAGRCPATSGHASREVAEAALRDYVRRNWDAEIGTDRLTIQMRWFRSILRKRLKPTKSWSQHDGTLQKG